MTEITTKNFDEQLPHIEAAFKNAKFIAIDTEFSGLVTSDRSRYSLFDTITERYSKMRRNFEQVIPVQIGLTAFYFDPDKYAYTADIFTFYIFPRSFTFLDTKFYCQSSSLQFLCDHKFDFNKFVYEGISFINRNQEEDIRKNLLKTTFLNYQVEIDNVLEDQTLNKWFHSANVGDTLHLSLMEKYKNNVELMYLIHKVLRQKFNKTLWTFENSGVFNVKKVTKSEFLALENQFNLENNLILSLLGFTKLFRLLVSLKKPLVGHNLLTDLMLLLHNFDNPLPKSYTKFKQTVHNLFPIIYDTKCISYDVMQYIPDTRQWSRNTLEHLYQFFKDGSGRHLVLNSPLIQNSDITNCDNFHQAGWDSYSTGYIFIRMAHVYAFKQYSVDSRTFVSSELLQAVNKCKNSVNIIRGTVSQIQLDGDDPVSTRPPWLIVEAAQRRPIDISQITTLLSKFGYVEVKPNHNKNCQLLVAVDNFGNARRIIRYFKSNKDFQIYQYSMLKHSPVVRAIVWSGVLVSSTLLIWLAHDKMKR